MIPIKLTLHNFMPYRDPEAIDFTGFRIASICGANGSGKSSIIDAITWALWGETRAKKDVELIHQGTDEVQVEYEFAVGKEHYKVLRKRNRPRRQTDPGQSALHLFIASDGVFRPIDGDTQTQTQKKIEGILHMDYDTFVNSAYLRQGHADDFTMATPAKRKQVLGNILGLGYYDELERRAREQRRKCEIEKEELARSLGEIETELAGLPTCEAEQQQAQNELARYDEEMKARESVITGLRQQKEMLEGKRAQLAMLERNLTEKGRTLAQIEEQTRQQLARIKEHEIVLNRREEIEAGYANLLELREQNEFLNKNMALLRRLEQKKNELDKEITRKSQDLVKQHAQLQSKVSELEKTYAALSKLKEDYQETLRQLKALAEQEESLQQKKQSGQQLLIQMQGVESEWLRLEKEIDSAGEKLRLLRTQKGAKCPLCGCELGVDGIKHIEAEYAAERQTKSETVKVKQAEYKIKQTELKQVNEEIALEERNLSQEKARVQSQKGVLERDIKRAEEAEGLLSGERPRIIEIEQQLTARSFALKELEQARQVEEAIAKLDYNAEKHEQVRQSCDDYQKYEAPKQKLDEADRLIKREREDLERAEKLAGELSFGLEADRQKQQELAVELKIFPHVSASLTQAEAEVKNLAAQQKLVQERSGAIKAKIENLEQLAIKKKEKQESLKRTTDEEEIYLELTEAFGKKGVQALIIETALPEIENEANHLLARMTDNRMNVKLETQRETQKGEPVETLDIKISDELGTRNYELFSGGEAFRINFAIRIALSRLLARRAGAPLPTLIIDEGFGTQDAAGIEKLKEAITTIQDDFEKILVITHIEELRDAFPARIDVVKTEDGSRISLN
jgi:exonuclease SbcC